MADLTTLANVKEYLHIATLVTTDDALLSRLITSASARIAQYLQRNIGTGGVTDSLNGSGTSRLFLSHWPVTAITSVTVNGSLVPAASSAGSSGWTAPLWDGVSIPIPEPVLSLTGGFTGISARGWTQGPGSWTTGFKNVVIVYTAGFATTPPDIELACVELVAQAYKQKDRLGMSSVNQAQQSTTFITKMLPSVVEALAPYRRVAPFVP